MSGLRSALYPLRLVGARLGRHSAPVVLVVLGIAAGASVVLGGRAGSLVAQDRAVAQAVDRIPEGSRSVRAVWFGVPAQSDEPEPMLERRARAALRHAVSVPATALVLFRETTIAGTFAGLGGVESLGNWVTLRSGRLPRTCTPALCEVLRLRGQGRLPDPAGLRVVEVGEAVLNDRILFGDFLAPTDNALDDAEVSPAVAAAAGYHRPPPPPLFLADGVETLAGLPALDTLYRSYAWVAPLRPGEPRLWEIDGLAAGVARGRSELQSVTSSFDLVAPVEELREAQATSRAAGRRLGIVGGEAAALLFAFALLAAMTLRTDLEAARRRLAWYGARGWQLALLTVAESGALALAGTAVGAGIAVAGGAVVAQQAGAPVAAVLGRSVLSAEGLGLALLVAAAATAVLVGAVASRAVRRGFGLLDAAAVAAIGLVALELIRGDGNGDLTLLLPALVTFAAAVLVGRLLRPALRGVERLARRRSLGLRLASLSLARNPGYAVVATAFLVVSFGLALFAESYRATLVRGERDQAAHRVPLDYVVREDLRRLIPVQDAASFQRFERIPGADVSPVLRLTGGIGRLEGESGITLLGIQPEALVQLNGWRNSDADVSRAELTRRIDVPSTLAGLRLSEGLTVLRARTLGGDVHLFAEIEGTRGRFFRVRLGDRIPEAARGGRLAGIVIEPATRLLDRGADAGQALKGSVWVQLPDLPDAFEGWIGIGGAKLEGETIRYTLTNAVTTRVRPRQPVDRSPLPVLVTRRLAAAADPQGLLPLQIAGERLTVRVVGTVRRFPGVDGQAVVGDAEALDGAVNLERPGAARLNEVWLRLTDPARASATERALSAKPFSVLEVESRRALEADAGRDPIAHGTLLALAVAAAVALALALAGILLTVLGDLRDERGELFDLEAQGASPSLLRRIVRARALAVAAAGLLAGALTGVALAAVVTDLVGLTARATAAEPPLVLEVDLLVVLGAALLYVLAAAALVLLATRRAFTASAAGRGGGLE
ncbi:MAG TPA: FtsX-like permease family protein [Gaiellaceae bacterium]|nr:FtsX-like permease family protein [Gaiellaceae bacterium]